MPRKPYQKQAKLDVPFEEALERFSGTDPQEVSDAIREDAARGLNLRGSTIRENSGNICLNDLWERAGKPENQRARDWHRSKRAQALEKALQARIVEKFHKPQKDVDGTTYYSVGRGGGALTYAHPVLALDYAEYVNADIGVEVREIFLRYRADDISLANDILDRIADQVQEDEFRVKNRSEITLRNTELAEQGKKAGCTEYNYAELNNAGYRGLYNGLEAADIHKLKRLTKSQRILDHMIAAEGAANVFRVTQAKIAMEQRKPKTPEEAFKIAHDAGVETREAMKRIGGVMPEDMEPADSISKAKKRLEENKKLLEKK